MQSNTNKVYKKSNGRMNFSIVYPSIQAVLDVERNAFSVFIRSYRATIHTDVELVRI